VTAIGTVIEEGDTIPEDVTGLFDNEDDPWFLVNGHWHGSATGVQRCVEGRCVGGQTQDPAKFAPLTVAAVRS
jgi:hypothetical protein